MTIKIDYERAWKELRKNLKDILYTRTQYVNAIYGQDTADYMIISIEDAMDLFEQQYTQNVRR